MSNKPKIPTELLNTALVKLNQHVSNLVLSRTEYLRSLMDGTSRSLNTECGYPDVLGVEDYKAYYEREGLAARVVDVWPDESWSVYPDLYETEDDEETAFEKAWNDLCRKQKVWHYLHRVDQRSGLGEFAILLIGFDDDKLLSQPVDGLDERGERTASRQERKVTFFRVFSQEAVRIAEWQDDERNPRYGQPVMYEVDVATAPTIPVRGSTGLVTQTKKIHWTRVLHIADNRESCETHGAPRMRSVFNRLFDLRKILGSSAEMFYKGGFPGYSFETHPDLADEADELDQTTKDQISAYMNGLKRYLALTGMTAKSLAPQVADPTAHVTQQLIALTASIDVPLPVFLGYQMGVLASEETRLQWNRKLGHRQMTYLNPMVIDPLVDRLMSVGALPIVEKWITVWRDLNALTDKDKAEVALKIAQTILQYVTSGAETIIDPYHFFVHVIGFSEDLARSIIDAANENAADPTTEDVWDKAAKSAEELAKIKPAAAGTNPTAKTGASGRTNGLGKAP